MDKTATGNDRPRVSICVPTCNGERYLEACLDSALSQTFTDIEVVVVDDASDDATLTIVESNAASDGRCRIVRNTERMGLPGNWNRCLEEARGEWIKFLFQDDCLDPDCVERMLELAERTVRRFVVCGRRYVFEEGVSPERRAWYLNHPPADETFPMGPEISAREFSRRTLGAPGQNLLGEPPSTMFHHSLYRRCGGFNTELMMICDSEYWSRLVTQEGFALLADELISFRVHPQSASSKRLAEAYLVNLEGIILMHDMAFAPAYEPLRRNTTRQRPVASLTRRLRKRAFEARDWAMTADDEPPEVQQAMVDAWNDLARRYPRISQLSMSRPAD